MLIYFLLFLIIIAARININDEKAPVVSFPCKFLYIFLVRFMGHKL